MHSSQYRHGQPRHVHGKPSLAGQPQRGGKRKPFFGRYEALRMLGLWVVRDNQTDRLVPMTALRDRPDLREANKKARELGYVMKRAA